MNRISKGLIGTTAAALMTITAAAPAEAQYRDRYSRHHDRGIDAGDIIAGVAIVGGIAAIASALSRDGSRYGYGYGYDRYRGGYANAVNSCAYEAQRRYRGRVQIQDVNRRSSRAYRVQGVIDQGGYYGRRQAFTCTARDNGRVTRFRTHNYNW